MSFLDTEVGLERGATKLTLDREPRHLNRHNRTGPARVHNQAITGKPITIEYTQETGAQELELALEQLTDAQATTLRTLADDSGPLTAKTTAGTSATYTVTIAEIQIDPIIGHYPDGAPAGLRYHRAELLLAVQLEIP